MLVVLNQKKFSIFNLMKNKININDPVFTNQFGFPLRYMKGFRKLGFE